MAMPRGAKPKVYDPAIVLCVRLLYEGGKTQAEIGQLIGKSQKVIWNIMRRHDIKARVAAKRNQWGENNHSWKGDGASKYAFHRRLYSRLGKPRYCSVCGTRDAKHYDYANLTGNYQDIGDYAPMCRSCHWKFDDKVLNIRWVAERRANA